MNPPLNLQRTSRTAGVTSDGRTVPLAWDLTTGLLMMKVAPYMPWSYTDKGAAAKQLADQGGVYLPDVDTWYRGVWVPAQENILDADYTRNQQQRQLRNGGGMAQRQITDGGYADKVGSSVIDEEEVEPPPEGPDNELPDGDDGGEDAPAARHHAPVSAYSVRLRSKAKKDKKKAHR